ncbi:MAG: DUF47 family protein [Thermoleophilia bacterium]|nr:DUF47 family protein [Thermoleophilia bacterium]MDH4346206.1 DUF47 family protein [Thermoleophilia bacterium]
MKTQRWFLPDTPDVLGILRQQLEVTIRAMDALVAWAGGDGARADDVRRLEHEADEHKRALQQALVEAFTTPYDPENLYTLSRGIDWVVNLAKDAVRESEVMACPPNEPIAEMAVLLRAAVGHLDDAVAALQQHRGDATAAADEAIKAERNLERVYRRAMAELLEVDDLREVTARRELYRRFSRIGETVAEVAERVWYAVIKES